MYGSIKYTHEMPVIFIPLEALFLLNSKLVIFFYTIRIKIFLKEKLFQFYQLQTLLSAELEARGGAVR
jgi:hypothetical protein